MASGAQDNRGALSLRRLSAAWLAGLVMLTVAGVTASVVSAGAPPEGDVGMVVALWLPLLLAPMLSGAAAVMVLRAPDAGAGEWLQAGLPVSGVAATYMAMLGVAVHGPSTQGAAFLVPAIIIVAAAATGAISAGRLKVRLRRKASAAKATSR